LQSCTKCKRCDVSNVYEPLDPSVQTFFDNMRQGDTLVFQDQFGNYDTAFYGAKTETWGCEECTYYDDRGRTECCGKKFKRNTKRDFNYKNTKDISRLMFLEFKCNSGGLKDQSNGYGIFNINTIKIQFPFKGTNVDAYIATSGNIYDSSLIISTVYGVLQHTGQNKTNLNYRKWLRIK